MVSFSAGCSGITHGVGSEITAVITMPRPGRGRHGVPGWDNKVSPSGGLTFTDEWVMSSGQLV